MIWKFWKKANNRNGVMVVDLRSPNEIKIEKKTKKPLSVDDERIANELCSLLSQYKKEVDQFRRDNKNDPFAGIGETTVYKEIRRIGKFLYSNGGHKRMLLIAYRISNINPPLSRVLEHAWHGIGMWQA